MSAFEEFVTAVEQATGRQGRRAGKNVRLLCPAHDDHTPSLDVAEGEDGSPLVQCRSHGCTFDDICRELGRAPREFLPDAPRETGEWTTHGNALAVYHYTDEEGKLLYDVCRAPNKQFPVRRPDPKSSTGWRWKLGDTRRVLYWLPEVLAAAASHGTVYVCEGEKDADAIRRAGGVGTCNPGGAGNWKDAYAHALAGANVVIVADNDEPGLAHAHAVAASLAAIGNGSALAVRIVRAKKGKDAADHLAAGLGLDDFLEVGPEQRPVYAYLLRDFLELDLGGPPPVLGTAQDTIIPAGGLVVLAGMPGSGKTTLALDAAFHLAAGVDWLGMEVHRPVNVLLVENEGPQHKFQEKLRRKAGHWPSPFGGSIHIQTWRWGEFSFKDEAVAAMTAAYLDEHSIDVVIGDPLDTLGPKGVGSPEDTREFVALLVPLGLTNNRTFLFLHHFRKEVSLSEINMVSGAWGGRLDTLLVLRETESQDELRLSFPKLRHAEERQPMILGKVRATAGFEHLRDETHEIVDASAVEGVLRQIISYLSSKGGGPVERQVVASMGCERSVKDGTFIKALKLGMDRGFLAREMSGRNALYSLTEVSWNA